ncbi:PD-(D/E)XK endonuclease [Halorubrum aquaticum]|uniref:PD-(D/E)XK endonuclease n=1 Tax=Halorubrum aquaticum TaxID=387340 RepID=A0A1I3CDP1_9EURY|nr:group I intron-associated PD-(D/E)XK endonuclease [Halorubrum aquaticum]SFH72349.1 PD-(D/E)XK endonuclease [Halorubrum aquaticum]
MSRYEQYDRLGAPQKRGQATEAIVRAELVSRGVSVLVPEYDNEPYDLAIEIDGTFYRIQAKTAFEATTDGAVRFRTRSVRTKGSGYEREGYEGKIDIFAVYAPTREEVYLIPIEDVGETQMTIRYAPARNGNTKRVNWYEDYLLDAVLPSLGWNPVG